MTNTPQRVYRNWRLAIPPSTPSTPAANGFNAFTSPDGLLFKSLMTSLHNYEIERFLHSDASENLGHGTRSLIFLAACNFEISKWRLQKMIELSHRPSLHNLLFAMLTK
jgi:hypothetical protein